MMSVELLVLLLMELLVLLSLHSLHCNWSRTAMVAVVQAS